jgi:nitronate monooxygenase
MTRHDFLDRLQVPVVVAPMFLVSGPQLVIAGCRAGIIGAFPTPNARPIEVLEDWLEQITQGLARARDEQPAHTVAPWCANLVTHSSNSRLPEDLRLVARYQPPLVVTALGSPRPAIEPVHGYGGLVLADVTSLSLARKAVDAGADGLACICHGAGGHTGSLSPFAFVSAVREFFDGLLVVGGAISDGWGVAGAIAAGADLVYMGTRFIASQESLADAKYKQMLVDSSAEDVVVSAGLTGTAASWLRPSLRANGIDPDQLAATPPRRSYDSNDVEKTKRWRDVWAAGQGVGAIKSVQPVAQIVGDLRREYLAAGARFASRLRPATTLPTVPSQEPAYE